MPFPGEERRLAGQFVICERGSRWAIAFRRAFRALGERPVRISETRSLAECKKVVCQNAHALAALEWQDEKATAIVDWIQSTRREHPGVCVIILGANVAWAAREAGAVHVVSTVREAPQAARMAQTKYANTPRPLYATYRSEIVAGLPWPSESASAGGGHSNS